MLVHTSQAAEVTSYTTRGGTHLIFVIGDIVSGDDERFKGEASKYSDATVVLESDGGKTVTAIEMGETIRLKGYSTAVVNGSQCNSACALIWLAGAPRALSRSARVGFHATYTDAEGKRSESGVGNAIVGRYLTLLNIPVKALVYATSAPPSSLNWVTASNATAVGIDVKIIDDIELDDASSSRSTSSAETEKDTSLWGKTGSWSTAIDHTLSDACFLLSGFSDGTYFRIGFNPPDGSYLMILNSAWASLREGQTFKLSIQFDTEGAWGVPVSVIMMGDKPTLMARFTDNSFWAEFIRANAVTINRDSRRVTKLNLLNSAAAFKSLIACQRAQKGALQKDPFQD
ncbi:hypothetical protein [Novosphingobium panipatense]|nr:hypothetical protein [Novosphingobium panipatense]